MTPEEPYKGLIQRGIGDSDYGGVGLWWSRTMGSCK